MAYLREDPLPVINHAPCQHLLSKAMFVTGEVDTREEDEAEHGHYCWCNMTQQALGPDGGLVSRQECNPRRSCYQPRW